MRFKEQIVLLIQARARRRLGAMATAFARAPSGEREELLAGMKYERWLAEACEDALEP